MLGVQRTEGVGVTDPAAPVLDERKLAVARLWAVSRHPYLAAAIFASPVVSVAKLGKVSVDESWRLYVDPELVDRWSVETLGSLLVHHAGHLVRDHAGRARSLGVSSHVTKDWALAADAEINDDLVNTGLRLKNPVLPQAMGWAPSRMAEEYFHCEHADTDVEPDCGSGADAQTRSWELLADKQSGLPPGERHLTRAQVAADVLKFCEEGVGRTSKSWRRWAEDMLDPKVDWRRVLAAEIRKGIGSVAGLVDYTYQRPSRRAQASPDVVLPAMQRPVPEIVVLCDTSGSMGEGQLARLLGEVDGLLRGVGLARNRLRVLAVDAAAHNVQRVSSGRRLELLGGGGTDMGAGVEAAAKLRPRPSVVVVLTDGLTPWPAAPPKGISVVIGMIEGGRPRGNRGWEPPEWARVVHIDDAA